MWFTIYEVVKCDHCGGDMFINAVNVTLDPHIINLEEGDAISINGEPHHFRPTMPPESAGFVESLEKAVCDVCVCTPEVTAALESQQ
jgi:hypothetical protein